MAQTKFHGRYEESEAVCEHPTCQQVGEFRAPGYRPGGFDGPGEYRWFCLEHVREFAGVAGMPRWADFDDPLDAIGARVAGIKSRAEREAKMAMDGRFSPDEARALDTMGLGLDTDRKRLRQRYSELVRRYHPDRNGGDRKFESRLNNVVEAYQLLRKSSAFA